MVVTLLGLMYYEYVVVNLLGRIYYECVVVSCKGLIYYEYVVVGCNSIGFKSFKKKTLLGLTLNVVFFGYRNT